MDQNSNLESYQFSFNTYKLGEFISAEKTAVSLLDKYGSDESKIV